MTSSASNPGTISTGIFNALQIPERGSRASMTSCGVAALVALYSGYMTFRNVPPGGSNATARYSGCSLFISSRMYLVNPKRMDMSAPFELIMGRRRNA